jgi:hypothetical protein
MSGENNGGPAFPRNSHPGFGNDHPVDGMTLRDYFAAKAMQALISPKVEEYYDEGYIIRAGKIADAMIKERARHEG